jgi:hypothetical protein
MTCLRVRLVKFWIYWAKAIGTVRIAGVCVLRIKLDTLQI